MEALIKDLFTFLIQHYALYLVMVMSITTALIMTILNYAKKPFKKLTSKIQNEKIRKFTNRTVIFIFSFLISFLVWYLLNLLAPQYFALDYMVIVLNGAIPIVTYAFAEGWITIGKAKSIVEKTVDAVSDGKLTKEEVKETASELNSALDAEQELNKLLNK